ncbi:methionine ABC transporter ATP-binding protein [Candidatus Liberibacter americanus]|uniref:Cell division ATP-binding protein FtsE n=1 Tax=Candidatus Liberibacter americanus str. Sao Paulo TaxID=1261131 RepID=U6B7N8_9HYPH|nr:ATP-binding cassette domain-containing protein [Candidatus Liberibacter americanus]AHA27737.1 Methionine ABC transporter ATP-binding protein [Candidatus Liberibacter americanus str. Sao Paulo]EMS36443.1 Methionine ABC transporter ATP-binding protein [Candidatus Liberibacter americanus PW_SP]
MCDSIIHSLIGESIPNPVVKFSGVNKKVTSINNTKNILNNVSFAISKGEITGIIGHSGAGKSTLMRMINKLETPTSGKIEVDGVDIGSLNINDLRLMRRRIGMIFQNFNLLSSRTVYDNIALPLEIIGQDRQTIASVVMPIIELMDLIDKKDFYPSRLSGGQKQLVGIARALATNPDILLADEATSALDPETTISCLNILKKINMNLGISILLITHEMEVIKHIASNMIVMHNGKIIESGQTIGIFQKASHNVTKSILSTLSTCKMPEELNQRIYKIPNNNSYTITRVSFLGDKSKESILSRLVKELDININIIGGGIDQVAGTSVGILIISYPHIYNVNVNNFFSKNQLSAEVLGYVD